MNSPEGTSYMSEQNDCAAVKLAPSEISRVHSEIVSFIWGIADDCLRDVYVRGKYRDAILPMTVIRRLDAVLVDSKPSVLALKAKLDAAGIDDQWPALCRAAGQAFCNSSPFILKDLTSRTHQQTLKADFEAYLDGFSPNVQEILEKFKFKTQIDTMVDADILGSVIEKFVSPDINLSPNPIYYDDAKTRVKLPGLDNHGMGTIFEELIRRFNEENNEEAGEHWTPRDVVELMADLVFMPIADQIKDATYSCYDGACGTGGMLTVAQDRLLQLAGQRDKHISIHLFGQEINSETYAICKADMLLKGDGEEADHISYGSTLSLDQNATHQFDFMLSNPPYGKNWKTDAEKMGGKTGILDSRFNAYLDGGEELKMIPSLRDGQLLFLLNNVSKMKDGDDAPLGSRIAEVHNGSSLFTGDAGSGESNARRYLIERDLVEAIIALPTNMFYNTPIGTYIWVLSNRKADNRKGVIQLIDAREMKSPLRRNLGKKNCELTSELQQRIVDAFLSMNESDISRILPNSEFGYWSISVERPLRLRVFPHRPIPEDIFKKTRDRQAVEKALADIPNNTPLDNWTLFAQALGLNKTLLKKLRPLITEVDPAAAPIEGEADPNLSDTEIVPFNYPGGIDSFVENEVHPFAPDAFVDSAKTKIGYEIDFAKYFYTPAHNLSIPSILNKLEELTNRSTGMMDDIIGRLSANLTRPDEQSNDDLEEETEHPANWTVDRNRALFTFRKGLSITKADLTEDGVPVISYGQVHSKANTGTSLANVPICYVPSSYLSNTAARVEEGDFIFADTSEDLEGCGNAVYVDSDETLLAGYHTIIGHPKKGMNNRYLAYQFNSPSYRDQIRSVVNGVKVYSITQRILKDACHLTPPLEEQDAIVAFLDVQCAAIDSLISLYRDEIEQLTLLKTTIVDKAVTGNLGPADSSSDTDSLFEGSTSEPLSGTTQRAHGEEANE